MKDNEIVMPLSAKKDYLQKLHNEVIKILYVIENEKNKQEPAEGFIGGLLFEINSANTLFDNKLTKVVIKLNGIYKEYKNIPFSEIRKQIFEMRGIIDYIAKTLE